MYENQYRFCPSLLTRSHLPVDVLLLLQAVLFELQMIYGKKAYLGIITQLCLHNRTP